MEKRGEASSNVSTEKVKALERRLILEGFGKGNTAALEEGIGSDAIDNSVPPGMSPGLAGAKEFIMAFRSAFPDLSYTISDAGQTGSSREA
ncbi:MAG: ester cyclase [Thaumarchaeota archaeon]|nr:ester cyclase [Nitrososphaerota archaeon]